MIAFQSYKHSTSTDLYQSMYYHYYRKQESRRARINNVSYYKLKEDVHPAHLHLLGKVRRVYVRRVSYYWLKKERNAAVKRASVKHAAIKRATWSYQWRPDLRLSTRGVSGRRATTSSTSAMLSLSRTRLAAVDLRHEDDEGGCGT
jgi:hypothetical protein